MAKMTAKLFDTVRVDLEKLLASSKNRNPGELIPEIRQFAEAVGEAACEALLASTPDIFKYAPALTRANYQRVLEGNITESNRLLQVGPDKPPVIGDVLSDFDRRYYDRAGESFKNVDLRKCIRLVMVGCGPCPTTIFHIFDRTAIPDIIGLDVVPDAIETARALTRRFGLSRVRLEVCDGQEFDYDGAQLVFISNMVSPKAGVLSRIADTAPAEVQIILRDPYSLGLLLAESGQRNLDPRA